MICVGRGLSKSGFWDFRDGGDGAAGRGDGGRRRARGCLARRVDSVWPTREDLLAYDGAVMQSRNRG